MNEGEIKIKIFLMRALDMFLLLAVFGVGIYSVMYAESKAIFMIAAFVGLFLVNMFGKFTTTKIAALRVNMEQEKTRTKRGL